MKKPFCSQQVQIADFGANVTAITHQKRSLGTIRKTDTFQHRLRINRGIKPIGGPNLRPGRFDGKSWCPTCR
ncbi:MAG TPA: hypothetical protein DCE47_05500 [Planctomycetaceae bacterium]|nr:hypothetical protein [Planctomycetaceae bacterium]|tara:strand:- start:73 stop:288 length:216 start_codon:yes stop_codon:yes gene_type:complete